MVVIYKICAAAEWAQAQEAGEYRGSADDLRDGFIHFSTHPQLAGTLAKHFAGREDLMLVSVEADSLGPALKWEPARAGDLFPHLYGAVPLSAVLSVAPLPLGGDGQHRIPEELP